VEVVVGPVPAASVAAYAAFAGGVLHSAGPGADVPSDAARAFDDYIEEWAAAAAAAHEGDVTWVGHAEPEFVEYLVYAFYRLAKDVSDEGGDHVSAVPDAAAPFYRLLVAGLLDALAAEGGSRAEFAAHLREFWPGEHEIP
jgi:hypothetical protein